MTKRTRNLLVLALCLLGVIAAGLFLAQKVPPRAARLLPEADGIVYADLKPIRAVTGFDKKPVPHSDDYQHFIDATGIVVERDLDSVAFALHRMPNPDGPNGPVAYSEVFIGHFNGALLHSYLASVATGHENYAGHDIYLVPVEAETGPASHTAPTGRILRVAQLGTGVIAASNAPTPEQIHAMLDRYLAFGSSMNPFAGPSVLGGLYPEVPFFSSLWAIGEIGLPFAEEGRVSAFGLHLPLADTTPFVASLRYTTGLKLRIEQIAATDDDAERSVQKLTVLLGLLRQMQTVQAPGPNEESVRSTLQSLKIEHRKDRAILTATIPIELVKKITSPALGAPPPASAH